MCHPILLVVVASAAGASRPGRTNQSIPIGQLTPLSTNYQTNKQDPRAAMRLIFCKMPTLIGRLLGVYGSMGLTQIDDHPVVRRALGTATELGRVLLSPEAWVRYGDI